MNINYMETDSQINSKFNNINNKYIHKDWRAATATIKTESKLSYIPSLVERHEMTSKSRT